jgi:hypothetical protein
MKEPWDRLVAEAVPSDHIVQLYQDPDFLFNGDVHSSWRHCSSRTEARAMPPLLASASSDRT